MSAVAKHLLICAMATALLVGCDNKPAKTRPVQPAPSGTAGAQRADDSRLVGRYKAQQGSPGSGGFYVIMELDLKADHTLTYSRLSPIPGQPDKQLARRATGTWTLDGDTLTVNLEQSEDGQPIPANQRTLRLRPADDGQRLEGLGEALAGPFVKEPK